MFWERYTTTIALVVVTGILDLTYLGIIDLTFLRAQVPQAHNVRSYYFFKNPQTFINLNQCNTTLTIIILPGIGHISCNQIWSLCNSGFWQ